MEVTPSETKIPVKRLLRRAGFGVFCAAVLFALTTVWAQAPASAPENQPSQATPAAPPSVPSTPAQQGATQTTPVKTSTDPSEIVPLGLIAIVPMDSKDPASAASVAGALQVSGGKAMIASNGAVTSGAMATEVTLPHRGVLRVCASTTVKLSSDKSVPAGEVPGLMMALDHGALEASFATGRNSDILLTPDFRILIGGPGAADVKVRLGQHGDTCVDNAGANAPYVLVSSVFDGTNYQVKAGQRVMFQHGSLSEIVDNEKEPCGCPPATRPNSNDFPMAQSAGLAPLAPPAPAGKIPAGTDPAVTQTFVYKSADHAPTAEIATPSPAPVAAVPAATAQLQPKEEKKPGFFSRVGHFFRRLFGGE